MEEKLRKFFHKMADFSPKNGQNFFAWKYSKTHFYAISRIYQKSESDQIRPNPTKSDRIRPIPTESDGRNRVGNKMVARNVRIASLHFLSQ